MGFARRMQFYFEQYEKRNVRLLCSECHRARSAEQRARAAERVRALRLFAGLRDVVT
jgi:hypothetical protein